MSTEENKAIIRRGFEEILNHMNLDAVDAYFPSNYVGHDPALPEDLHGPEEFRQFAASYLSAFPDLHITIEDQFAEGDKVVTRFTSRGTHQGDFVGISLLTIVTSWATADCSVVDPYRISGAQRPPGSSVQAFVSPSCAKVNVNENRYRGSRCLDQDCLIS